MNNILWSTATKWEQEPFPHAVVYNMWDDGLLNACADEFPGPNDPRWITYNDPQEYGKAAGAQNMWGPATHEWFRRVREPYFSQLLTELTGIEDLEADDLGGGMHQTHQSGRLASHIDFGVHPRTGKERRINFLTFLNHDWQHEWGGTIVLGDPENEDVVYVEPTFNTTVIFETSNHSWHGHPDPIMGNHLRKSLAVYFYAPARPETIERAGTTIWLENTRG